MLTLWTQEPRQLVPALSQVLARASEYEPEPDDGRYVGRSPRPLFGPPRGKEVMKCECGHFSGKHAGWNGGGQCYFVDLKSEPDGTKSLIVCFCKRFMARARSASAKRRGRKEK